MAVRSVKVTGAGPKAAEGGWNVVGVSAVAASRAARGLFSRVGVACLGWGVLGLIFLHCPPKPFEADDHPLAGWMEA